MGIKIGINGFGRIGRGLMRVLLHHPQVDVVAINDIADQDTLIHLLKYDSIHRAFPEEIEKTESGFEILGKQTVLLNYTEAESIPWQDYNVDIVIESTGKNKSLVSAQTHLKEGVKHVIISAPADDDIPMVVLGVNEKVIENRPRVISNASCTTNSAAPMIKIVNELCDVEHAYITTVHSYTTDQRIHDAPHKDLRRARAAALSIVPTTTGAAKAVTRIFPALQDKIGGCGIRVPVPDGSLTDITFNVRKQTSVEEVNAAFKKASEGSLKGILGYTSDPIVSSDIIGMRHSVLFDDQLTSVIGNMVKVVGWYDNEIGYSNRIADLIIKLSN